MDIKLQKHDIVLLELLKSSLNNSVAKFSVFEGLSEKDWKKILTLSQEQGVTAIAWGGIILLPNHLLPPRSIKLPWALKVENYKKKYTYYVNTFVKLNNIYNKNGIDTVVLKGIGLSSYYPIPEYREGGDIDIYTFSKDKQKISDSQANQLADKIAEEAGILVDRTNKKHSVFNYRNVPIENHKWFVDKNAINLTDLNTYLKDILNPETIYLLDGKVTVSIPSPKFNTIFLAIHAIRHIGGGFCLHHLCDWACLLKKYGLTIPTNITDPKFIDMIGVFTHFTNKYLGTHIETVYPEKLYNITIKEMLYPNYPALDNTKKYSISYTLKRLSHYLLLRKQLLGESIIKGIANAIIYRLKKKV